MGVSYYDEVHNPPFTLFKYPTLPLLFLTLSRSLVGPFVQVEIEDFVWDALKRVYHYPCPCGDRFEITKLDLKEGEDIAKCPSCSLLVRVIYDQVSQRTDRGGKGRREA